MYTMDLKGFRNFGTFTCWANFLDPCDYIDWFESKSEDELRVMTRQEAIEDFASQLKYIVDELWFPEIDDWFYSEILHGAVSDIDFCSIAEKTIDEFGDFSKV